jgi:acyl-coenzyme A synthetase/AMP-(fatty) acid ligase
VGTTPARGTTTAQALADFCRQRVGTYKSPDARDISFARELPRNALGKLLRRELKATRV